MVPYVMAPKFAPPPSSDFGQTNPALGIPRMASLLAEMEGEPDEEALDLMSRQVEAGFLADAAPSEIWPELVRGLMGPSPSKMLRILRQCGALPRILPEVAALFGVPQISDEATDVDLGEHVLNALAEAALCDAPLAARFALLVMNVGKADSPPEHLPVHYKHMDRGSRASKRYASASARRRNAGNWPFWRWPNASVCTAFRKRAPGLSP